MNSRIEIVRLQNLIKKLEMELHECCLDALDIGELAGKVYDEGDNAQHVAIAVHDACDALHLKYDYRVRGYDAENIILDEIEG